MEPSRAGTACRRAVKTLPLTPDDEALLEAATRVIQENYVPDRHHVGAAVRARSGRIYTGVHLESRVTDICAEPVALGAAASQGERSFDAIVAVAARPNGEARVLSPCGTCRELITRYGPEMTVLIMDGGQVRKVRAGELLPKPYRDSP